MRLRERTLDRLRLACALLLVAVIGLFVGMTIVTPMKVSGTQLAQFAGAAVGVIAGATTAILTFEYQMQRQMWKSMNALDDVLKDALESLDRLLMHIRDGEEMSEFLRDNLVMVYNTSILSAKELAKDLRTTNANVARVAQHLDVPDDNLRHDPEKYWVKGKHLEEAHEAVILSRRQVAAKAYWMLDARNR